MAKRATKGTASGIRKRVEVLTTPLPKDRKERVAEKNRRKRLSRGPEMTPEELQLRQGGHRTRVLSPNRSAGTRAQQQSKAIEEHK